METTGAYTRAKRRDGRVSVATKVFQGVGAMPEAFKAFAFNTFLLFYYNQVLGVPAAEASSVLGAALIIDAVVDPLVGSFSDNLKTRLGRRHLLMYLSALPLGLALFLVFSPPAQLSHAALVAWLFAGAIATNVSLSFFVVPWSALYAEFSDDYDERTEIVTYRGAMGALGAVIFTFSSYSLIFRSSARYPLGQLDPHAYGVFAPILALCAIAAILVATHLTRREIPYLLQPASDSSLFSLPRTARDIASAFANRQFLVLFLGALLFNAISGTTDALGIYSNSYFWGLRPEQLRWFVIAVVGAFAAFATVSRIEAWLDKKPALILSFLLLMADGVLGTTLRLLDILPHNGDPRLLAILIPNEVVRVFLQTVLGIMFVSMIADTLDLQELRTGKRQEGVFSAAISFSSKTTAGLGAFIAGILLQHVIQWPAKVNAHHLAGAPITRLGVIAGIVVPLFFVLPALVGYFYTITRESHAKVRAELDRRRTAQHLPPEPTHDETVVDLEAALLHPATRQQP